MVICRELSHTLMIWLQHSFQNNITVKADAVFTTRVASTNAHGAVIVMLWRIYCKQLWHSYGL